MRRGSTLVISRFVAGFKPAMLTWGRPPARSGRDPVAPQPEGRHLRRAAHSALDETGTVEVETGF
jgi:hypothetical protein